MPTRQTISPVLLPAYQSALQAASISERLWGDYTKWLRFYLDFCFNYRHLPRDADSLEPFLQKLASKNQPRAAQEQAAHSVSLYYDTVKNWPAKKDPTQEKVVMEGAWDSIYRKKKRRFFQGLEKEH